MASSLAAIGRSSRAARLANARRDSAVASALFDGARQVDVSRAAGVSQPAISQLMAKRRTHTIGARWTIPILAGHLRENADRSMNEVVRSCAQFSSDFRKLTDPIDREIALGAPESTGSAQLDALVAGLADYEAWRVGVRTPLWANSPRYSMFPSWFAVPSDNLKAFVMRNTPPQFSVRGIYLDAQDLESM